MSDADRNLDEYPPRYGDADWKALCEATSLIVDLRDMRIKELEAEVARISARCFQHCVRTPECQTRPTTSESKHHE